MNETDKSLLKLQLVVFALITASFTNMYVTQPILPVLQIEFNVSAVEVSMTVSAVILGIVISNLFFGYLADRITIHPIILTGGLLVAAGGIVAAISQNFTTLIGARFVQGLFIPALTTSISAWLARTLPAKKLAVVMGSYVSATILGGLGGRLLGGWVFSSANWRYALVTSSIFVLVTTFIAAAMLPSEKHGQNSNKENKHPVKENRKLSPTEKHESTLKEGKQGCLPERKTYGFFSLLQRKDLLLIYLCGGGSLLIFSPVFNYLPYRLSGEPFNFSTEEITLMYFVYILGIFLGPVAGKMSNKFGGGNTLIVASVILALSLLLLLTPFLPAVILGLLGSCAGFFTIHAVGVGLLNQKLTGSHGKANALYILFYYTGGWLGITGAGFALEKYQWNGVIGFVFIFLLIPLMTGIMERESTTLS
jgi:YNFM family putative membrane transporter